ncbi:uncharacterized protein LOC144451936 [Glandiceps talaboti]
MSRATVSKSRADKNKSKDSDRAGTQSASVPPISNDVVPGRFTEGDWSHLLEREEGEEFIVDMVEEIVDSAMTVIYDNYIQRQLFPYTITQAKDAILQIIEWQFLARDEGEGDVINDQSWQEEGEPIPAVTDSWAQGSVPRSHIPIRTPTPSEHDTEVTSVSNLSRPGTVTEDDLTTFNETSADEIQHEELAKPQVETIEEQQEERVPSQQQQVDDMQEEENREASSLQPEPPKEIKKKRKFKYKPHRGPIKSAGLKEMTKTLEETEKELIEAELRAQLMAPESEADSAPIDLLQMPSSCHSILKAQAGRPPGNKDVTYDEKGNVVSVLRMDPERLPSHRIKTQFSIVDPAVEAAHARLIAMRTGRYRMSQTKSKMTTRTTTTVDHTIKTNAATTQSVMTIDTFPNQNASNVVDGAVTPLPPPLLDSMELAPGVLVKEGNRIRRGPKLKPRQEDIVSSATIRALRPLTTDNTQPRIQVAEILGVHSPVLRPIPATEPIPPIMPQPPIKSN